MINEIQNVTKSFKYYSNRQRLLTRLTNIDYFSQVELRKAQTELQAASDTPALTKDVAPSKDTKPDRRDGVKPPGGLMHMNNCRITKCRRLYIHVQHLDSFRVKSRQSSLQAL